MRVTVPLARQRRSSSIIKSQTRSTVARRQMDPIARLQRTIGNNVTSKLLRKASGESMPGSMTGTHAVGDVLSSAGRPLDAKTQTGMGARFNFDFSGVRVHDDARAAESALSVSASAYTVGNHVVFGHGQYSPSTAVGQRLLAHELTHVVQQSDASAARLNRKRLEGTDANEPILDLGSAKSLACCDTNACVDDKNGFDCKDFDCAETGDKSAKNNSDKQPGHKFSPRLKCESKKCKDFTPTYTDSALIVALPSGRRQEGKDKCGQTLGVCANGKSVEVTIGEYSNKNVWEASPGVAAQLGVSPDFKGSIYPSASDPAMKDDPNCHSKPKSQPKAAPKKTEKQ